MRLLILAGALTLVPLRAAVFAQTSSISGTLTDAVTGSPLVSAQNAAFGVFVYDIDGALVTSATTASDGSYAASVNPGTYFVETLTSGGYVAEVHSGLACIAFDCVVTSGTPVVVATGATAVNFALRRGGSISGSVRRANDGSPVNLANVVVYNAAGSRVVGASGLTGTDGAYTIGGLAAGVYFARTIVSLTPFRSLNLVDELYGGAACFVPGGEQFECRVTSGTPIVVTAGGTTAGIDFSLDQGGVLSGRITDEAGQPINNVQVKAFAGDTVVAADDTVSGEFIFGGLPAGTYAVRAGPHVSGEFVAKWYDNRCWACGQRPTPVAVTAGAATTGVDFVLSPGGAIEGTLRYTALDEFPLLVPPEIFVYNSTGDLVTSLKLTEGPGPVYAFQYRIGGLPSGTYYVKAWDGASVAINSAPGVPTPPVPPSRGMLVGKLYNGITCVAADCRPVSGTPVAVTAGSTTTGIDFALEVGGTMAGVGIDETVQVFDARGVELPQRSQHSPGNRVTGLPAGTYYLRKTRGFGAEELHRGLACPHCPPTFGTPIVVASGQHVTGIDFTAPAGRAITGTVRDADTLSGLSNVTVEAYNADGRLAGTTTSSFGGSYRLGRLNAGTYFLRTVNARNYADEVYDNFACSRCSAALGTAVVVGATADTAGIDFSLAPASPLEGVITSTDGFWLPGSRVSVFDASGMLAARATASTLGRFTATLPGGSYRARTDHSSGYVQELFDDLPCAEGTCDVATGTPIVLASTPVTNIDFSLAVCGAPTISPLRLATAAVGISYRQTFGAAGGTPPRRFTVVSGVLPPGLTLDGATGVLSGTPAAPGSHAVTVGVADSSGCSGARDYVIDVHPCAFALETSSVSVPAGFTPWIVHISNACGNWTASTNAAWITPHAAPAAASVILSVHPNTGPEPRTGTVIIGPRVFTVRQAAPEATPPFGFMDVPRDGDVVDGSIAVGGWALDDLGVSQVNIYRNSVPPEPFGERVLLGTAVFVEGARPDVEAIYPGYPDARRAGWGFMLLTNMLPGQGNGAFQVSAYAVDVGGTESLLGIRTIIASNATATTPFGAIDTPRQGETVSGEAYLNFGWALTPQPKAIPVDGSTFRVYVDGVPLGPVTYNNFRADIAGLFPGYANSSGAVGYRVLDTTRLEEGLHTIAWTVVDNLGASAGIGSRYFTVANSAPGTTSSLASGVGAALRARAGRAPVVPPRIEGIDIGRRAEGLDGLPMVDAGTRGLALSPLDRLELALEPDAAGECAASWSGYHVAAGETRALPAGSSLDPAGTFYWQPGPAFAGSYELVFVRTACDGERRRLPVRVGIPTAIGPGR